MIKCDCYDNEICVDRNLGTVLKGSSIYGYGFFFKKNLRAYYIYILLKS